MIIRLVALMAFAGTAVAVAASGGCGGQGQTGATTATTATTVTAPPYQRRPVAFFKGLTEPRAEAWQDVVDDADSGRLKGDGFNTVTIEPPVLIAERGGGKPGVILEGQAASASTAIGRLHQAGIAVFVVPSTKSPGLNPQVDSSDAVLQQLNADVLKWAGMAQQQQAELFAPLDDYNLVLGTDAGDKWSRQIIAQVRQRFHGPIAAKVAPDLGPPPPPGYPHDFERLDYKGYDYLLLDVYPTMTDAWRDGKFNQTAFTAYVDDLMVRAKAIEKRDGLKGVIIQFGAWREQAASETPDGPALGAAGQADMAARLLSQVMPQVKGVFFHGWTLPGRGAKGFPVEDTLSKFFGGTGPPPGAITTTAATVAAGTAKNP